MAKIINWYVCNLDMINFFKDVILSIGYTVAIIEFIKFIKNKKYNIKKEEIEYDKKLSEEIDIYLAEHFKYYEEEISKGKGRDICFLTIYVKNYPFNFKNNVYKEHLFYYRGLNTNKPTGYSSKAGIYVYSDIWMFGQSLYMNEKTAKWFVDDRGLKFKRYKEYPKIDWLVYRIPYTNIVNYDFRYDGTFIEPVLYVKYKGSNKKMYGDEILAIEKPIPDYSINKIELRNKKRTYHFRLYIKSRIYNKIKAFIKYDLRRWLNGFNKKNRNK